MAISFLCFKCEAGRQHVHGVWMFRLLPEDEADLLLTGLPEFRQVVGRIVRI